MSHKNLFRQCWLEKDGKNLILWVPEGDATPGKNVTIVTDQSPEIWHVREVWPALATGEQIEQLKKKPPASAQEEEDIRKNEADKKRRRPKH